MIITSCFLILCFKQSHAALRSFTSTATRVYDSELKSYSKYVHDINTALSKHKEAIYLNGAQSKLTGTGRRTQTDHYYTDLRNNIINIVNPSAIKNALEKSTVSSGKTKKSVFYVRDNNEEFKIVQREKGAPIIIVHKGGSAKNPEGERIVINE